MYLCSFGDTVYRQQIGITICTSYTPIIEDLFLYCCESQVMAKIQKYPSKQHLVDHFNDTFRYLDDILALYNFGFLQLQTKFILLNSL